MLGNISGQVAWLTGAGSGIGEAGALALAGAGVKTVLSGRRVTRLEQLAEKINSQGGFASVEPLDVASKDAVDKAAKRIAASLGRIDILVHSAGLNIRERGWDKLSPADWNQVIDVDLNGAFNCCHAVLPIMKAQNGGLIINISSWAGRQVSRVSGPAYSAAKHAMNAMNESINMEQCQYGIRACAICPGEVATEILDKRPVPVSDEDRQKMVQSEDVGDLILYVSQVPAHVCLNEIVISPTWNRGYIRS